MPVGTTSQTLLPGSVKRVALVLMGSTAGRVTLSNDSPAVLDNGITILQQSGPIELRDDLHGEVIRAPWFAIAAAPNSVIGIIEVLEG